MNLPAEFSPMPGKTLFMSAASRVAVLVTRIRQADAPALAEFPRRTRGLGLVFEPAGVICPGAAPG